MKDYEIIIGLEIHLQLNTKSKMFSSNSNEIWQAEPNSLVGPVELGLPGALPVPNTEAIKSTQRLGKSLECNLRTTSKFDRKNYFYPDLPKGYQISQYDEPFCEDGFLMIKLDGDNTKKINIRRIHLEEDTGKSSHTDGNTYLDFNKAGVPLVELVTEPDFRSAEECSTFAKMIQQAVRVLNISSADMEKGNMRLEANISVREAGTAELPDYRVEVKNINSFKFMRDAINYEVTRQINAIENGEILEQETRGWNVKKGETYLQRSKENAHDYRYFPEPDIPPFQFDQKYFDEVLVDLPEMPWHVETRLVDQGVRVDLASLIAYDHEKASKFSELAKDLNKDEEILELVKVIANTSDMSQVEKMLKEKKEKKAKQSNLSGEEVLEMIKKVIQDNPKAVEDYNKGKENSVKFLLGQIMRETKGQVNPQDTEQKIIAELSS